jgi:hypothetical protein
MSRFRDAPIKRKLVVATVVTTGIALALAGLGNILADAIFFRNSLRRDLKVIARIMADNSTAALQFDDPEAATQILAALRARPHVDRACVYRQSTPQESRLFARYAVAGLRCPAASELSGVVSQQGALAVTEPIVLEGRRMERLYCSMTWASSMSASRGTAPRSSESCCCRACWRSCFRAV